MAHEARVRAEVRRHARRTNPASLRLARVALVRARGADAEEVDGSAALRRHWLGVILGHLRECEAEESTLDRIRARYWERRERLPDMPDRPAEHWTSGPPESPQSDPGAHRMPTADPA